MVAAPGLYEGYIFDLDGTVYLGDELLPGAFELITTLRELNRQTLFLSNNPTKDPQMYADKLNRLGLPTPVTHIVNPVITMVAWLCRYAGRKVFVIGEEPLIRAIRAAGIETTERADEIDIVIASYDRTFEYRKLQIAFDAIWQYQRARLITIRMRTARSPVDRGAGFGRHRRRDRSMYRGSM